MSLYGMSLNAVSTVGPGTALAFDVPRQTISMSASSVNVSSCTVALQGSLDGINWYPLSSVNLTGGGSNGATANGVCVSTSTPALYVRANLTAIVGNGFVPFNVSAVIAASLD